MKKRHIVGIVFVGLGIVSYFTTSDEDKAERAGFSSVSAYENALEAGFDTKSEYDAHLEIQRLEAQAAQSGFADVSEMQDAKRRGFSTAAEKLEAVAAGFETKAEYDAHLEQQRKRTAGSIRLQPGFTYKNYTDGSCKPRSKEVCISQSDYKVFCSRSPSLGVMYDVAKKMSIMSYGNFGQLIRNGVRPKSRVSLKGSNCVITSEVSGMLNGSQVSDTFRGRVTSFYVDKEYNITVQSASDRY